MNSPHVAIYARQSSDEDQGIRQQIVDCQDEARRRGWKVVALYRDNDVSGSKERGSKTDWAKMLRAFDAGEFDTLLVNDADRLTRSLSDVLQVRPPQRNIRVVVVRGSIDTAEDDYMLKQLVLLAEREVKLKATRARRYAIERRKAGHPTAGKTPHGYKWIPKVDRDDKGTRYAIHSSERVDVERIFEEFLRGASMKQIARDLNADGRHTRSGARWHASTVRRILLNPLYAAKLPPAQPSGGHDLAKISLEHCEIGAWEPIVDEDHLIATRNRLIGVKPNHEGTARRWLLSGLAVCGTCRGPVRSASGETHPTAKKDGSGKAPSKRYHAYRCRDFGHFMRNGDIIDAYVAELCIARLSRPDVAGLFSPRDDSSDLPVLHAKRTELEGREAVIASMIATGKMKPSAAEQALDQLTDELKVVNQEIARVIEGDPLSELADVSDVRKWWEGVTLARRRTVIELLMTVTILPVGYGRKVKTLEAAATTVGIEWKK